MPFNNIYSTSHELRAASVEAQPEPEIDDLNDPNEMEIEETTNQNEEEKENVVINRARDDHDMKKQRSNEMLANVLFPGSFF